MTFDRFFDRLRQWGRPWTAGAEPLEIHRALLEDIEAQVVAVGGGRRLFPFDRVEVKLFAAAPEERTRLEAIAQAGWDLEREVRERLEARGARVPEGLSLTVEVTGEGGPEFGGRRYALAFSAAAAGAGAAERRPAQEAAARPLLRLAVVKGTATRDCYDFAAAHVYLGRLEEVLDAAGRVKRRNHVAFVEEGELNQTVSREHARIAWDPDSHSFWLRDEGSASGTLLFRAGRSFEVSRHDRRGVRLLSGDEIYLGRAAVRVEIGEPAG
ncbi:MAG TPA: FHA domain-containing protein [Thermoanaerobaculia bacterium]|nr:FHA domain-containing protein [Thermoanaerobaculia bacterium]